MLKTLFLFSVMIIFNLSVRAEGWEWLHPKPTGQVLRWCKMWDANTWYLAGSSGMFMKTTNAGANWFINTAAGRNLSGSYTDISKCWFFNQLTGICACGGGLTRTTDGGLTFDSIPNTYGQQEIWESVYFSNNLTGYAVSFRRAMIKTTDGGITWNFMNSFPALTALDVFSTDGNFVAAAGYNGAVYISTDGGVTWNNSVTGSTVSIYSIYFFNNTTGIITGLNSTVKLTTDGGLNWTDINTGLPPQLQFSEMHVVENDIYLSGSPDYIYRSGNFGDSWDTINIKSPLQPQTDYYLTADIRSPDTILTAGINGLMNTVKGSTRSCYTQFARLRGTMNAVYPVGQKIWGAGAPSFAGFDQVIYSSDGGATWSVQHTPNNEILNSLVMLDENNGYAGGAAGTFIKTTNGGMNWVSFPVPAATEIKRVDFVNVNTGWVFGSSGRIYKTTEGGANWTLQNSHLTNTLLGADMLDEMTGWCVGGLTSVVKTTNGGEDWFIISDFPGHAVYDIKMINANTGYVGGGNQLFSKTTDGGASWAPLVLPVATYQVQSLDFINEQTGIITLNYNMSLKTTNGGSGWLINSLPSFTGGSNKIFMVNTDLVYNAGSYTGIFKYTSGLIGTTNWQNTVPGNFSLKQNYPNPFNPSTVIEFSVPKPSKVSLKIYDVSGRLVKTIFDNAELNAGMFTHTFDASQIASGVYFYSLTADNVLIDSKKMAVVK